MRLRLQTSKGRARRGGGSAWIPVHESRCMQHSPTGPYGRRRRRATIALIESDWLDVKMWSKSRCVGLKLRWSRGSRCRGNEMFGSGQGALWRWPSSRLQQGGGGRVEMGLSGWLGRRFGQDAVARVRNTMGLGGFGLGRWALCCAVLRCAALLSDVVGTKARRAGARRNGKKRERQRNRMPARGKCWLERLETEMGGERERERD